MFMRSIFLLSALIPALAYPSTRIGNGGFGVEVGGEIQLLDLYEAGAGEFPFQKIVLGDVARFGDLKETETALSLPSGHLPAILSLIESNHPGAGISLGKILAKMSWTFEAPRHRDMLDYPRPISGGHRLVLIAKRVNNQVFVNREFWNRMPALHRLALIVHESVFYSLAPLKWCATQDTDYYSLCWNLTTELATQNVRATVRYLLRPQFQCTELVCHWPLERRR